MEFFAVKKLKSIKDWARELSQFCAESDLSFNECNFHVMSVNTLLKKDDKELPKSFFKEAYDQSRDEIYQTFDVEISPKEYDFSKLSFSFNNRHLEATLTLHEGFLIDDGVHYMPQLVDSIIAYLIQKGIIITSTEMIKSRTEKIISENFTPPCVVMEDRHFTFLRSKATNTHKGFTNLLKKRWCKERNHAALQGALYAVSDGEPIGFFLKEAITSSGRNLQGEYMDMKQLSMNTPQSDKASKDQEAQGANFRYKAPPEAIEGIKKIEEGGATKYESQGHGIIELAEAGMKLIDIATFQQVSLKTGCILGGVNKSVEVDIDCPDNSKDAVQAGAIIEAEVVNIKGNVGERVIIRAKRLTINGQTHQSALLYSDEEASITIHKGVLYGNEVDIDKLEGGKIFGGNVNVLDAQGSKVVGTKVVISNLHSNNMVRFSEKLHIKAINGKENQVVFDIFSDMEKKQKLSTIIQRDTILRNNIAARVAYCKSLADKLHKIKPIIENLRPLVERSKKEGFELDAETKKTLGFYVLLLKQIKEQKDYANQLQKIRTENTKNGEEIEESLNEAKITTESSWKDSNQIVLTRRFPASEKKIFTQDSEMFEVFINIDGEMEKSE